MPRKPGLGPRVFRIESMSTGREYRPPTGTVDDWGQPIVQPIDGSPVRPIADPQVAIDAGKRKRAADQRALLAAVFPKALGIEQTVEVEPKMVAPSIPNKRAIVMGSIALHVHKPAWRR